MYTNVGLQYLGKDKFNVYEFDLYHHYYCQEDKQNIAVLLIEPHAKELTWKEFAR